MKAQLFRPRVTDMIFRVYSRPLHPELFEVLASRQVKHLGYTVTVKVTRTGHVITWEKPNFLLTETATAFDTPLPESRRLLQLRLKGEQTSRTQCTPGLSYQMLSQVELMTPEIFLHVHNEILLDGTKRGLLHRFDPHHRFALTPMSFISVEACVGRLFLTSFHTFPDEYALVKTQSLIEMKA